MRQCMDADNLHKRLNVVSISLHLLENTLFIKHISIIKANGNYGVNEIMEYGKTVIYIRNVMRHLCKIVYKKPYNENI
jgi:urease gamma subunit